MEKRDRVVDLPVFVERSCHAERMARIHQEGYYSMSNVLCVSFRSFPANCSKLLYHRTDCVGANALQFTLGMTTCCFVAAIPTARELNAQFCAGLIDASASACLPLVTTIPKHEFRSIPQATCAYHPSGKRDGGSMQ